MKKLILSIQVFIFLFVSLANAASNNLRLPDGYILEAALKYQVQTSANQLSDIRAYYGRYGATLPNELKQKIIDDANGISDNTKILWTLKSTYQQALIYKEKLAANGIKVIIVEIPDSYQERILSKMQAAAQGLPQLFWWHAKDGFHKIASPKEAAKQFRSILKDQFEGPKENDLFITYVKLGAASAILGAGAVYSFSVGLMPEAVVAFSIAKLFFLGTTAAFSRTISNFIRTSYLDDFSVESTLHQMLRQIGFLGFGVTQATSDISAPFDAAMASEPIDSLAGSTISGISQVPAAIEANNSNLKKYQPPVKIKGRSFSKSDRFTLAMFSAYYTPLLILSSFHIKGIVWAVPTSIGTIHLTAVQGLAATSMIGLYLGLKIYNSQFEKNAEKFLPFSFQTMLKKAATIQKKILILSRNPFYTKEDISEQTSVLQNSYAVQPVCASFFQ